MADSRNLLVVIGPTASGKSALAMEVARQAGGEILSVDSMQVYRGMDIGTAKPRTAEQAQVRHHLIDLVEPTDSFTVARFVELADAAIAEAKSRGANMIATGGTPLYYKALFEGLFEGPSADPAVRERLSANSNEELHRRLTEVDPEAASRIHSNDTRRMVRALEVFEITGRPISSFQTDWAQTERRHRAVWIGISWEKDAINRRINARVREMIAVGWVEEVRALIEKNDALSPTASEATGYFELIEHVSGRMSLADAVEQIKIATRQLARRQMKWLRRFPNVTWLGGDRPLDENVTRAIDLWNGSNAQQQA